MFFNAFSWLELWKSPKESNRFGRQWVSSKFGIPMCTGGPFCVHFIFMFEILQCFNRGNRLFTYSLVCMLTSLLCSWWKIEFSKFNRTFCSLQLCVPDHDWCRRRWSKNIWSKLVTMGRTIKSTVSSSGGYSINETDEKTTRNSVHDLLKYYSVINFSSSYNTSLR
jgi:hypothetical protein